MQTKTCTKCKQELPFDSFTKDRSRSDGLYPQCRSCRGIKKRREPFTREKLLASKKRYNDKRRAQMLADGTIEIEREYGRNRHRLKQADNPEYRERARQRSADWYYSLSPEERRAMRQERQERNPEHKRQKTDHHLRRLYGITADEYDEMLKRQDGCCSICGRHESQFRKRLFVDHCHTTGNVRELLCAACNFLVGTMETTPNTVAKATEYLERHT